MGIGSVECVVEVDETFFRESFKGNHRRRTTFAIPRNAHKRGVKDSNGEGDKRKRGISKEQICVLCAMDRIGNIITELVCKGKMKYTDIERLFRDRIDEESILCTDSHKSFVQFAHNTGIELHQIKRGKHKEGLYHIQHIKAFHSKLKKWLIRFNGVATK